LAGQNPYESQPTATAFPGSVPLPGGVQMDGPIPQGTPNPFPQPVPGGLLPDAFPSGVPISRNPQAAPGIMPVVAVKPNAEANVDAPLWPTTMQKPPPAAVAPKPKEGQAWKVIGR